jgi:hypothetical protein
MKTFFLFLGYLLVFAFARLFTTAGAGVAVGLGTSPEFTVGALHG